jgi:hypothetical protein
VRQRREIVEREALLVQIRGELPVCDPGFDGHLTPFRIEADDPVQAGERDESVRTVGDAIEAVACAQRFESVVFPHQPLQLFERRRVIHPAGAVLDVAGPVRQTFAWLRR